MQCCKEIPSTFSLVLGHRPHTGFKQSQPRISEKIQELYNQLEGHSDKISEETSNGILEGFSEASWPYWFHISKSWLQWISLIHVFLILGFFTTSGKNIPLYIWSRVPVPTAWWFEERSRIERTCWQSPCYVLTSGLAIGYINTWSGFKVYSLNIYL